MKKNLLIMLTILLGSTAVIGQAPGIFNYQGVARNSVGNVLINKTITLRLTIHDLTAAGTTVYQESRSVTTNPFGLFNAQVGSAGASAVTGTVAGVNWSVGNKFIQVEIDPNGGSSFINIGTAQIASVPYSLFATTAGDLVLPFIKTQSAPATTLIGLTNSSTTGTLGAFTGTSASTDGNANAITGTISSTSPGGFSAGVRGINNGTGGLGIGVWGSHAGAGWGVYGTSPNGIGVHGNSSSGFGLLGLSNTGTAVSGNSSTGVAGLFENTNNANTSNALVANTNGSGNAVNATNTGTGRGGNFLVNNAASTADALRAETNGTGASWAIRGISTGTNGAGLFVQSNATNTSNNLQSNQAGLGRAGLFNSPNAANPANAVEVVAAGLSNAILGNRTATTGTAAGVRGESASLDGNAVGSFGIITSTTPGGFSSGVRGINNGTGGLGIGVYGSQAGSGWGVYGTSPNGIGVHGNSAAGFGIYGISTSGVGVYGTSSTAQSGVFEINNNANSSDALLGLTNGGGIGVHGNRTAITGTAAGVRGESASQDGNAVGTLGVINSNSPGGFSAGVRGINNGTGGLGIGVYGTQAGSGWGVYGSSPTGIGVNAFSPSGIGASGSSSSGTGIYGNSTTGVAAQFQITNAANTSNAVEVATSGIGGGILVDLPNASNGARGIDVHQQGVGTGVFSTSAGGSGVWGITSAISAAGVIGDNTFGEAVVGRNRGGLGVGAVVGRNDSTGYGVRGFNTKNGIGVLGQAGISGGTGIGGRFENVNAASTSNVVEVATNGIGGGILVDLPNASNGARGIDVHQQGVGPGVFSTSTGGNAVWGITSSISAAGVIGDNTFGEAVVGRNRGGLGVGAVVGRNDSTGYGVRGFNTKNGIGVLGQTGISGGSGNAGRFENVNAANSNDVVVIATNGPGDALIINNANGAATNLAVFRKSSGNVARIDDTGKGFFNGGTQVGGADVAEYFDVEGLRNEYEAGDVLVISQSSDRKVEKSSAPYSTLVSGVFATKPGVMLTEKDATADNLDQMVPMGVIGVIPTKVCLEGGAIKRGDLLVTSSISGVAMKADLDKVKVGQVIGKALQDYNGTEVGKINVLVSVK